MKNGGANNLNCQNMLNSNINFPNIQLSKTILSWSNLEPPIESKLFRDAI